MNISEVIYTIRHKIALSDYSFTNKFLEKLKEENKYLYDLTEQMICKKNGYIPDFIKNPIIETDNEILNAYYYEYCNYDYNIFDIKSYIEDFKKRYEIVKQIKDDEYENIAHLLKRMRYEMKKFDIILDAEEEKHDAEDKYIKLRNIIIDLMANKNTEVFNKAVEEYEKEYPNFGTQCFNLMRYYISYYETNDFSMYIKSINEMYGNIEHEMLNNFYKLAIFEHSLNYNNTMRLKNKRFLTIKDLEIPEIENYNEFIKCKLKIDDCIMNNKIDEYYDYLETLINTKSKFIGTSVFSDYISMNHNKKEYEKNYNIYKTYNLDILIKSMKNPLHKSNTVLIIIASLYNTNRMLLTKQFDKIFDNFDIKYDYNGLIKKNIDNIMRIKTNIEIIEKIIITLGFEIINDEQTESCVICFDDVEQTEICAIKCNSCQKKLGHVHCVVPWINNNKTCPNCRFEKV
jgi:hypothetical protein